MTTRRRLPAPAAAHRLQIRLSTQHPALNHISAGRTIEPWPRILLRFPTSTRDDTATKIEISCASAFRRVLLPLRTGHIDPHFHRRHFPQATATVTLPSDDQHMEDMELLTPSRHIHAMLIRDTIRLTIIIIIILILIVE
mmetsp:Transcript_7263/g.21346  ORF Transcript_7263/g.21346 Transcript_7263/m.21346 type:complete len:140 (+) Transcript_7263:1354-1773(+)